MFAPNTGRRPARRGAILLVVLAMLALFAVIALSFALYSESEATSMRNARAARNEEAPPNAQDASNDFLRQLTFGTNDNTSAVYGHDFATTKYGWNAGGPNYSPYSGNGLPTDDVSALIGQPATTLDRKRVVNHTRNAASQFVNPHLLSDGTTPINKSTPYTYPDRANFYLAMQNPLTGEIVQPSFHRPDLFDPSNNALGSLWPFNPNWSSPTGRYLLARPLPVDHPNFPFPPANADGTYTGDVANLKYTSGIQKNDSLWIYAGAPVKTWRGKQYTSVIAPLILDLNSRVNLSVAGNNRNPGLTHASSQGFGAWEVNPTQLGISAADLQTILNGRYGQNPTFSPNAPPNRYTNLQTGTINGGLVPPKYSLLDPDMIGTGAADPMALPAPGTFNPFLTFTARFAPDQATYATEMTNHPQTFNPFHWQRGNPTNTPPIPAHALGMDDLVRLAARYSDPKNRYAQTELGVNAPTSFVGNTAVAMQNRALTTGFSVTQSWAEVQIATGAGTFAKLGPIDLNRKLADYRTNPAQAYSPSNVDAVTPNANYVAARQARQLLATDIFLRLAALVPGLVDGTNVTYNPITHSLNPVLPAYAGFASLQKLAQYAVNMVDAIDSDDIQTAFVWNPINAVADPTDAVNFPLNTAVAEIGNRIVYGTELNRLVINEAYCKLDNDRLHSKDAGNSPNAMMGRRPSNRAIQKKYWVELHNPLPLESATSTLSEQAGARLQYVSGTSPGATLPTHTYAVHILEIAETTAAAAQPLYNHLTTTPTNVLGDPALVGAPLVNKLRVSNYTYSAVAPAPAATLIGDERNVVRPIGSPAPAVAGQGGNAGYYVIAPTDPHPSDPTSANFKSSMCIADPAVVGDLNAMMYEANPVASQANIDAARATTSSVVLRRLANPYLPPQPIAANPAYNPYITVDFLENVPTRDRVQFTDIDDRNVGMFTPDAGASIGRYHPYASMPAFAAATPDTGLVVQQTLPAGNMTSPPHSLFSANYKATVQNPGGLAAYVHYDRELLNSSELLHVSIQPPALLTGSFSDGTVFQRHNGSTGGATPTMAGLLNANYPAVAQGAQLFKAFDLLTTANRLPGIPLGGREPGKVNLNTATDTRILQAVLDPQLGNRFDATFVNTTWTGTVQPTRTPNWGTAPYVRATFDETGVATADRPFKLMGSPSSNYEDTLYRSATPQPPGATYPFPMLFSPVQQHPYFDEEPHRKALNNLTTVSDGFLVIWTVGFFEVDGVTAAGPTLGKELFDKVPGDLRAQYAAVVDRSTLQIPPEPPAVAAAAGTNGAKPWETKLLSDATFGAPTITVEATFVSATAMTVYNEAQVGITVPNTALIRLGYGNTRTLGGLFADGGDGEWVKAASFAAGAQPGTVIITLDTTTDPVNYPGIQRLHGASTRVSNTLPGNPGPQPTFDPSSPANRHIVPYFTRLDP